MAAIETPLPAIRLGIDDATDALALSTETGWNQTCEDWLIFLEMGTVHGIHDDTGALVATAALLPYGATAWISMVLVTASRRRQGLASRLMTACIAEARLNGLTAWLDATPAGATVYGLMGFVDRLPLRRYRRVVDPNTDDRSPAPPAGELADLIDRDADAMGCDRSAFLQAVAARPGTRIFADEGAIALVRDGRTARHIGPVLARHSDDAMDLVDGIVRHESGSHVIDVVGDSPAGATALTASGWQAERPFRRMSFPAAAAVAGAAAFAVAGPEFG